MYLSNKTCELGVCIHCKVLHIMTCHIRSLDYGSYVKIVHTKHFQYKMFLQMLLWKINKNPHKCLLFLNNYSCSSSKPKYLKSEQNWSNYPFFGLGENNYNIFCSNLYFSVSQTTDIADEKTELKGDARVISWFESNAQAENFVSNETKNCETSSAHEVNGSVLSKPKMGFIKRVNSIIFRIFKSNL